MGQKIEFTRVPIEGIRRNSEDFALMLEWFDRVGYDVDIDALRRKFSVPLTRFEDWAKQHAGSVASARG
ncbi:MAG: hypothetical protein ACYC8T_24035, partial [Myxococcaceae bacterium]